MITEIKTFRFECNSCGSSIVLQRDYYNNKVDLPEGWDYLNNFPGFEHCSYKYIICDVCIKNDRKNHIATLY